MSANSMQTIAFVFSIMGGIIIIAGSVIAFIFSAYGSPYGTYSGMGMGMMGGYWFGYGSGWMWGLTLVSLVCGALVLIGAIMLNARPHEQLTWGIVVLAFSVAGFIGMGGYFIGAILGIVGGAIALSYRKPSVVQKE